MDERDIKELKVGMQVGLFYKDKKEEGIVEGIGRDWVVCRDSKDKALLLPLNSPTNTFEFIS